jgi:hypothetical protein
LSTHLRLGLPSGVMNANWFVKCICTLSSGQF